MSAGGDDTRPPSSPWPEEGLESVVECPVCGSDRRHVLYDGLRDRVFFSAPGEWRMIRCEDCRCAYLDPRPTESTIQRAYENYYTHELSTRTPPEYLGLPLRLRRALANGYRNWRYGTNYEPATRLGLLAAWLFPSQRRKLDVEFRYLPRSSAGGRVLDVGFGNGVFLERASDAGWEAVGVDPDPVAVDAARERGLEVRRGGLEAFSDMPESFDVLTLAHVIEHVPDPRGLLRQVHRLLKPGGRVWIDTPNIASIGHQRFGRHWRGLEPPRHIVLFNWTSLESLLVTMGFGELSRLTRVDLFPSLAQASRAIADGRDPYDDSATWLGQRVVDRLSALISRLQPRQSEFVTLVASKPGAGETGS